MPLYLSQLRLSRSPAVRVLETLLHGDDGGRRRSAQHNLLWSAFSESPDQTRDFLWRAESDGSFLALSSRLPRGGKDDEQDKKNELFEKPRVKEFAPVLKAGDCLAFQLQANATRVKRETRERVDIVMDALRPLTREERREQRMDIAQREGEAWLARQGERAGFSLVPGRVKVDDYRQEALPRFDESRRDRPQLGILDFSGVLKVREPDVFLAQLVRGFGRAKAFGCGLMLVRRAS